MGTVHRGLDPRLERPVALKTIRLDTLTTEDQRRDMLERLRHEAVTIAAARGFCWSADVLPG